MILIGSNLEIEPDNMTKPVKKSFHPNLSKIEHSDNFYVWKTNMFQEDFEMYNF